MIAMLDEKFNIVLETCLRKYIFCRNGPETVLLLKNIEMSLCQSFWREFAGFYIESVPY